MVCHLEHRLGVTYCAEYLQHRRQAYILFPHFCNDCSAKVPLKSKPLQQKHLTNFKTSVCCLVSRTPGGLLALCSSLSVTGDLTKIQTYFVLHCSPSLPASNPYSIAIHGSCCDLCNYLILPSGFHLTLERLDLKTRAVCHSAPLLIRSKA